jgi:2,4'-dihydroxyacetophenone dioxygenase
MRDLMKLGEQSHAALEEIPWAVMHRPYGTVEMRLVRCSPARNVYTNVVRWPAGTRLPRHLHTGDVHSYTFRGKWGYAEYSWRATAGSFVYEPTGTSHTLEVDEDTEAMFTVAGGMVWYGADGRLDTYQEAADLLVMVEDALTTQGLELPDHVVQD